MSPKKTPPKDKKLKVEPPTKSPPKKGLKMKDANTSDPGMPAMNGKHLLKLEEALTTINDHGIFGNLSDSMPLAIDETETEETSMGVQAPYDTDDYASAMKLNIYRCAGNLGWLNLSWRPDPSVPVSERHVNWLKEYFFAEPTLKFPIQVVVGVSKGLDPMQHKGDLKCVVPCEYIHSFIFKVAEEINNGADEETLKKWRQSFLTIPMVFEVLESEQDMWKRAKQLRDRAAAENATVTYTPAQKIFSVIGFKKRADAKGGKLSATELTEKYNAGTTDVPGQEAIAEAWVDAAVTVWERVLSKEDLRTLVMGMEEEFTNGGPLNSVYKLNELVKVCRTEENMNHCLVEIRDLVANGSIASDEVAVRTLNGKGIGGKGLLHLLLYKLTAKRFLHMFVVENSANLDKEFITCYQETFATTKSYRDKFGFDGDDKDISWISTLQPSGQLLVRLTEAAHHNMRFPNLIV